MFKMQERFHKPALIYAAWSDKEYLNSWCANCLYFPRSYTFHHTTKIRTRHLKNSDSGVWKALRFGLILENEQKYWDEAPSIKVLKNSWNERKYERRKYERRTGRPNHGNWALVLVLVSGSLWECLMNYSVHIIDWRFRDDDSIKKELDCKGIDDFPSVNLSHPVTTKLMAKRNK